MLYKKILWGILYSALLLSLLSSAVFADGETSQTVENFELAEADSSVIIAAIAICIVGGIVLSFYIIRTMKNKYK